MLIVIDTNKLVKQGFAPKQIKQIKDTCVIEGDTSQKYITRIPMKDIATMLKTTDTYIRSLSREGRLPMISGPKEDRGFDVGEILRYLWESITGQNIEQKIKEEKLTKLIIANKVDMKELISRTEAEDRMCVLLRAIQRMFMLTTKAIVPLLRGCNSTAEIEKIIIIQYKEFYATLEKQCEKVEWKDEKIKTIKKKNKKAN